MRNILDKVVKNIKTLVSLSITFSDLNRTVYGSGPG
jgi:hypothetical protein